MDADLLQWLAETPGALHHPELADRLQSAGLFALHLRHQQGEDVREQLEELYRQAVPTLHEQDLGSDQLEQHLLEVASQVDFYSLRNQRFLQLEAGDAEALPAMESELRSIWQGYADTPVEGSRLTQEMVVVHHLLKRAFHAWFSALAAASDERWEEALQLAEGGNALLYAVSEAQDRFAERVGSLGLDVGDGITGSHRAPAGQLFNRPAGGLPSDPESSLPILRLQGQVAQAALGEGGDADTYLGNVEFHLRPRSAPSPEEPPRTRLSASDFFSGE